MPRCAGPDLSRRRDIAPSYSTARSCLLPLPPRRINIDSCFHTVFKGDPMGKYFLAWLIGVPGIILVLVYLFFR